MNSSFVLSLYCHYILTDSFHFVIPKIKREMSKGPNLNYSSSTYMDEFPVEKAEKVILIREVKILCSYVRAILKTKGWLHPGEPEAISEHLRLL